MDRYLEETPMLDYGCASIRKLIRERGWMEMPEFDRLRSIYNYVRDEVLFGYNVDDNIPASRVLSDGYGQCNTKGTLFMAAPGLRDSLPCAWFYHQKRTAEGCHDRVRLPESAGKHIPQLG